MTKKTKIILMLCSLSVTAVFFMIYMVKIIMYFKNPMSFNFTTVFIWVGLLFLMLLHAAYYVMIMEDKPKVRKVEDIEEWWTKWDRE